ncbi:hypothetical protein C8Q79DRAFT_1007161 [Trametes meyenii]|nr:hypothetical protein C8Q79DRAFT_1007161 [Trametes meyenii]
MASEPAYGYPPAPARVQQTPSQTGGGTPQGFVTDASGRGTSAGHRSPPKTVLNADHYANIHKDDPMNGAQDGGGVGGLSDTVDLPNMTAEEAERVWSSLASDEDRELFIRLWCARHQHNLPSQSPVLDMDTDMSESTPRVPSQAATVEAVPRSNGQGILPTRPSMSDKQPDVSRLSDVRVSMRASQRTTPTTSKGKGREHEPGAGPSGLMQAASDSPNRTAQGNLAVKLLDNFHGLTERMDATERLQQSILNTVQDMNQTLAGLGSSTAFPTRPNPSSGLRSSTPSRPGPRRSSRKSYSKSARVSISQVEREDFTEEINMVTSGDESGEDRSNPTPNSSPAIVGRHLEAKLLKIKKLDDLPKRFPSLTDEELTQYDAVVGSFINESNFRIDFTRGWNRCSFNREARQYAIDHFLECTKGGAYCGSTIPKRYLNEYQVGMALDSHMAYMRAQYKRLVNPDADKDKKDKTRKAANTRRNTLYISRLDALERRKLQRHYRLFDKVKAEHMSGDEAVMDATGLRKQRPYSFKIVDADWASAAWKRFMRSLDAMNIEDHEDTGGNGPRVRIEQIPPLVEKRKPPKGLPRNCYDADWIAKQKPHAILALEIQDYDYDFSMST